MPRHRDGIVRPYIRTSLTYCAIFQCIINRWLYAHYAEAVEMVLQMFLLMNIPGHEYIIRTKHAQYTCYTFGRQLVTVPCRQSSCSKLHARLPQLSWYISDHIAQAMLARWAPNGLCCAVVVSLLSHKDKIPLSLEHCMEALQGKTTVF